MTRLLLARHGETDWNREGRWQGHLGPGLNARGREQAAALARRLSGEVLDLLYTSDLDRAVETAATIAARSRLEVVVDPELREVDVGDWSGMTRAQIAERDPAGYQRWLAGESGWSGGETYRQMHRRAVAALERIAEAQAGRTVVVVSHGGPIRAMVAHVVGLPPGERRRVGPGQNCALSVVERLGNGFVLASFNDHGHLASP